MRVTTKVCLLLIATLVAGSAAVAEDAPQAPPAVAKLTEKKFSHQQYSAAILGKIVFRKGKKPFEKQEPVKLTLAKTDAGNAAQTLEVKDGEAFILQAVPGSWQLKEVERLGRVYPIGQPFSVRQGNVVFIGLVDVVLKDEDRSSFEYEYRLDSTVENRVFNRNLDLGRAMNGYAPPALWSGDNVSLFAPTYPVESATRKGEKSLAIASEHGDVATVRELLGSGDDPSKAGADGWTPLHSALRNGHREIAELLLDRGASLAPANSDGWTPLMIALRYDQEALAARMIQKGADVGHRSNEGWTPLMLAVRNGQPANARLLLERGAPVEDRTKSGTTALMLASGFAPDDLVATLIEKDADVTARDGEGWTTLMWALRYQKREAARRLVEKGVDIQAADNEGWTALMYALRYELQDVAMLLLDKGARTGERNKSGWTALHFALRNAAPQAARRLIDAGVDVNRPTSEGWTALMYALRYDQGENARLLVEKGAEVDVRNQDGWTPLMFALRYNQSECARLLAQKSKRIDDKDKDGWTALMYALRYAQAEAASILIQRGAAFDYRTEGDWECLLTALRYDQAENARKLILKGANVNAKTDKGWTALMFAIEYGQAENAKLLIERHADATVATADGTTALSLARKKKLFDLTRLLGGDDAPAPAAASAAASPVVPAVVAEKVPLPAGTAVVRADDCAPGLNGVTLCTVVVQAPGRKTDAYDAVLSSMKKAGWTVDRDQRIAEGADALEGRDFWGVLGLRKKLADGLETAVVTFRSPTATSAGRMGIEIVYQRFPATLKTVTYPQVLATYPAGAEKCDTVVDVIGVNPNGSWKTLGVVRYRNFQPQLKCLGTKVTLQVATAAGGVQYEKGTKLTVDKALNWIEVKSWD